MAATLLGRQFSRTNNEGVFESLFIADAAIRQSHFLSGSVTSHPVEGGASISDHVICEAPRLSLECAVSNTRFCNDNTEQGFAETSNRIGEAYRRLRQIKENKEVFDVATKLDVYRDMVIETIDVSQDADTCAILRFRAELVQVRILSSTEGRFENTVRAAPVNRGEIAPRAVVPRSEFVAPLCLLFEGDERDECIRINREINGGGVGGGAGGGGGGGF